MRNEEVGQPDQAVEMLSGPNGPL